MEDQIASRKNQAKKIREDQTLMGKVKQPRLNDLEQKQNEQGQDSQPEPGRPPSRPGPSGPSGQLKFAFSKKRKRKPK